jgi:hypothetical protein
MGSAMTDDNVILLADHRGSADSDDVAARAAQRNAERSKEAIELLNELRRRKPRLKREDRAILARNLGRVLLEMEPDSPKRLAKKVLQSSSWQKRKRYVRLPDDPVGPSVSYAASGLDFAGIIERLAAEKARRGIDRGQAVASTVYDILKDSSFRRPSRFQIGEGSYENEGALLVGAMKRVFDKLAQDVELAKHFERVSKYSIHPDCPWWQTSNSLALDSKYNGNDIYDWDWLTDDDEIDLQSPIPWWAPRCLIGHLYIPFHSRCFDVPEQGVADLKDACGGEVTRANWRNDYWEEVLEPFLRPDCLHSRTVYHRSPVLLIALPRPSRLVPCLYVSVSHPTGFQQVQQHWSSQESPLMPRYVAKIGDQIGDDHIFFYDTVIYPDTTFYVCVADSKIIITGSGVDDDLLEEFEPDLCDRSSIDEIPDWLHPHPVQRFLKFAPDSDMGTHFALTQRNFPGRRFGDFETVFRPHFADSSMITQLRPNTIGAYLLRNFSDDGGIFERLKGDALEKITATKEVIDRELSKFQKAFDKLYGQEASQIDIP